MNLGNPSTRYSLVTAFFSTIGLLFYWWSIIRDSHLYLFSTNEEGIRNYFVTLYYALYDKQQTFTGLNYPYPENISFSNAQPLFSIVFQKLLNGNFEYAGNVVSIMNLLMIFSIPLGAVFIYRIFSLWRMPNLYSSVFATAIALLSPQILKMTDNIAFSYVCFFPMIWYYSARWLQDQRVLSLFLYLVTLTIFGFIHTFYLGLGFVFTFITVVFYCIYKIKRWRLLLRGLALLLFSIIPFVIYFLLLNTESSVLFNEKPSEYMNFLNQKVSIWDIAIPLDGLVKNIFNVFWPIQDYETHGYAYLGMSAILSTLLGVWVLKDRVLDEKFFPHGMGVFMLSATVCIILALQIPFNIIPIEHIPMVVFRFVNLNAFAWVFYFVFTAISAWLLYILSEYLRKKSYSVTAVFILILIGSLWCAEALAYQKAQASRIRAKGKLVNDFLSFENSYSKQLDEIGIDIDLFQGLIAFPYFNKNANFSIERDDNTFFYATKSALNLHLSLVQNYKNNADLKHSVSSIQLLSNQLIRKEILNQFDKEKSLLLLTIGSTFQEDELRLIDKARLLIQKDGIAFYDLPLSAFSEPEKYIQQITANGSVQYKGDSISNSKLFWKDFNYHKRFIDNEILAELSVKDIKNDTLEFSLWIEIPNFKYHQSIIRIDEFDQNGILIQRHYIDYFNSTDVLDNHIRVGTKFLCNDNTSILKICANIDANIHIGSLMIKPVHDAVFATNNKGVTFLNNFPLE